MLRKATQDDIDFIIHLEHTIIQNTSNIDNKGLKKYLINDKHSLLILEKDFKNIGYIHYVRNEKSLAIYSIAVLKKHQHKGYGKYLMKYIIDIANSEEKDIILEVDADKDYVVSFYDEFGFRIKNIMKDYYGKGTTAFKMIKKYNKK